MNQQIHQAYTNALTQLTDQLLKVEKKVEKEKSTESIVSTISAKLKSSLQSLSSYSDLNPTQLENSFLLELEQQSLKKLPKDPIVAPIVKQIIKALKLLYAINKIIKLADLVIYAEKKESFNTVLTQFKNSIIALAYLLISRLLLQREKQLFSVNYAIQAISFTSRITTNLQRLAEGIYRAPVTEGERKIKIQINEYITIAIILHEIADSKNEHKTSPTETKDDIKITKLYNILILLENSGFVKLKLLANHAKHLLSGHPKQNPTDILRNLYRRIKIMLFQHKDGESVELHKKKNDQIIYAKAVAGIIIQFRKEIADKSVILFIESLKYPNILDTYNRVIAISTEVNKTAKDIDKTAKDIAAELEVQHFLSIDR